MASRNDHLEAAQVFVDPSAYADQRRFDEACALLRREAPVQWVEADGFNPFWAVTRHADVVEIETRSSLFLSAPRPLLDRAEADRFREAQGNLLRTLVHMDDPDHKVHRAITAEWFQPRSLKRLEGRMAELARRYVDRMAELGGGCDFVTDVAAHYPLYVILSVLGLPESDFPRMLRLTQELFGANDPEQRRGTEPKELLAVLADFFVYFMQLTTDRRGHPTDDLASVIANARPGGELLGDVDVVSYYMIIATAGHDTTSSTMAGGLLALLEHPEQLKRLQADPALLPTAVDEMIRWVTPVKQFMRTATDDYPLRGTTIRRGDSVLLSYASANRDEDVFGDPFIFDVGRRPNRHIAFGHGPHFCLGVHLAKMEIRALYSELLPRLDHIELAGDPALTETLFVGGLKRLPIRYRLG